MSMIDQTKLYREQAGVVSIMVVTMLIIIVSLVVLGLAQISRRETRLSLDTQLSAQAYYAAESGFNEAAQAINADLLANKPLTQKPSCADDTTNYPSLARANSILSPSDDSVRFTCVLIDTTPSELRGSVGTESSVFYLKTATGNFQTITIRWSAVNSAGSVTNCPANGQPSATNWQTGGTPCPYAMLRMDLANAKNPSRASLVDGTTSGFLRPSTAGVVTPVASATKGFMSKAQCTAGRGGVCTAQINVNSSSEYYLRLSALYQKADVTITATTDAGGANAEFVGSQAQIDVTGKAQDVLRRLVVAKPLTGGSSTPIPGGAIVSGESICKRFTVDTGAYLDMAPGQCSTAP